MLEQIHAAAAQYESDYGCYPPGEGTGSDELVSYLTRENAKKLTYFLFTPEMLHRGHIRNPIRPDRSIVYYLNPGVHNPRGVDLWCADREGRPDGINNWE